MAQVGEADFLGRGIRQKDGGLVKRVFLDELHVLDRGDHEEVPLLFPALQRRDPRRIAVAVEVRDPLEVLEEEQHASFVVLQHAGQALDARRDRAGRAPRFRGGGLDVFLLLRLRRWFRRRPPAAARQRRVRHGRREHVLERDEFHRVAVPPVAMEVVVRVLDVEEKIIRRMIDEVVRHQRVRCGEHAVVEVVVKIVVDAVARQEVEDAPLLPLFFDLGNQPVFHRLIPPRPAGIFSGACAGGRGPAAHPSGLPALSVPSGWTISLSSGSSAALRDSASASAARRSRLAGS